MRYGSVCSGIEAATAAWHPLGWQPAFFSEIEAAPRAVLAHHYPDVPCHGDFTTIGADEYGAIDLLVGGTPCQSFSVAGLRGGLADDRGNLALQFLKLAERTRARWVVWENVPGVLSSSGGRDFGSILGGLVQLGYGFAYRVLDAQFFGVPQRRRRVFVVGHIGDWRRAAAVLFERHSLSGDPAPRRQTGQGIAAATAPSLTASGRGVERTGESRGQDPVVAVHIATHEVAGTMMSYAKSGGDSNRIDNAAAGYMAITQTFDRQSSAEYGTEPVASTVSARDYKSPSDLIAIQERAVSENPDAGPDGCGFRDDGMAYTLEARTVPQAVCFSAKDHGADASDIAPTLRAGGHSSSHANAGVMPAVTFPPIRYGESNQDTMHSAGDVLNTLPGGSHDNGGHFTKTFTGSAVRRLTPRECERLQGFPDDFTLVPYRKGMMADGPRYKMLGNSMAVPVMAWIGERIAAVEALSSERLAA